MAITLYTDLDPDECVRRLGATGWAGKAKPREWQPTTIDRDIFRTVEGPAFRLAARSVVDANVSRAIHGRYPEHFHGRLNRRGMGTVISGYYGSNQDDRRRVLIPMALGIGLLPLFVIADSMYFRPERYAGIDWPAQVVLIAVSMVLTALLFTLKSRPSGKRAKEAEDFYARFLARALEARPMVGGMDRR